MGGRYAHLLRHSPRAGVTLPSGTESTRRPRDAGPAASRVGARPSAPRAVRPVPPQPGGGPPGLALRPAPPRGRRAGGCHPPHLHAGLRGPADRRRGRPRSRDLSGGSGTRRRRHRPRERRAVRELDAHVLARARPVARVRAAPALVSGRRAERPGSLSTRRFAAVPARFRLAPDPPRPHARARRRGRNGPLPAGGDARGHPPGLRAHGARQGPAGAEGTAGACAAERSVALHYPGGPDVSLPAHRRRPRGVGVRVAGYGATGGDRDPPSPLLPGPRREARDQRDGGPGQPDRRRAVCGGRPTHPGPRRMNLWNWLALGGAAVMALTIVAEIRRRTRTTLPRPRFFRQPTAAPGLFVLAFFVTVALAAPLVAPCRPYQQTDIA